MLFRGHGSANFSATAQLTDYGRIAIPRVRAAEHPLLRSAGSLADPAKKGTNILQPNEISDVKSLGSEGSRSGNHFPGRFFFGISAEMKGRHGFVFL